MWSAAQLAFRLASALAIGLLIGAERERHKGEGPRRSAAGVRTFALAALVGGISVVLGGNSLLAVSAATFAVLSAVAYVRTQDQDPGLTSEGALVLTVLLGGLAQTHTATASALAVVVTIMLAARVPLHRFVSEVISESELADGLIFAAATLVVLPLMPDRYMGPFDAINPRIIWKIVILVMLIGAAGYVAVRLLGLRLGLPIAGLASGFVSSTATVSAMGARALQDPSVAKAAAAGAVLSTVATIIQLAVLLAATNVATVYRMRFPLIAAGVVAIAYGLFFMIFSLQSNAKPSAQKGRAFSLKAALLFASLMTAVLVLSAAFTAWLGEAGATTAAAVAGLADAHAAAVSVGSLVSSGKLTPQNAVLPILAALTANTFSKVVVAISNGGRAFALRIIPGLLAVLGAAWLAAFLGN